MTGPRRRLLPLERAAVACFLAALPAFAPRGTRDPAPAGLRPLAVGSSAELEAALGPVEPGPVAPLGLHRFPDDLEKLDDIPRKKRLFFRSVLPLVLAENRAIRADRERLLALAGLRRQGGRLPRADARWLGRLAEDYRVDGDPARDPAALGELLRRVDTVPAELALAQAANESAWGGARFTREGNALFGQWTFEEGEGMVPRSRREGRRHEVRAFRRLQDSVRAYLRNLNAKPAYGVFRLLREQARKEGRPATGEELAAGLDRYSERGEAYIEEIRELMRENRLERLRGAALGE